MPKVIDTRSYADAIVDILHQGHCDVPLLVAGGSMIPFLHSGDNVYLNLPPQKLKPGQIILYQRADGSYVLHRIQRVRPDGSLILLGDAQTRRELVQPDQVRAVATAALRSGKRIDTTSRLWRFFAVVWRRIVPLRPALFAIRSVRSKIKNR